MLPPLTHTAHITHKHIATTSFCVPIHGRSLRIAHERVGNKKGEAVNLSFLVELAND